MEKERSSNEMLKDRFYWMIMTIIARQEEGITKQQLFDLYRRTFGKEFGDSTFGKWKKDVREKYGLIINIQRPKHNLVVENPEIIGNGTVMKWMFETAAMNELLNKCRHLHNCILLREYCEGVEHVPAIVNAIQARTALKVYHVPYDKDACNYQTVLPLGIKQYNNRLYLVAIDDKHKNIKTYGLDRIKELHYTDICFKRPKDFSMKEYFKNCYGVYKPENEDPVDVVLRIYENQRNYVKTDPIQETQQFIGSSKDSFGQYDEYKYNVYLTKDFIAHILKMGHWIEVVSPKKLRDEVADELQLTRKKYKRQRIDLMKIVSYLSFIF